MKTNLKKIATLAVLAAALALQSAHAQIVPAATFGDLIFGAETVTGGTASGNDLEVDLGSISNFTVDTPTEHFANVTSADLTTVLGSGYGSSTSKFWSVVGTNGGTASGASVGGYNKAACFLTFNVNPGAVTGNTLAGSTVGLIASTYNGLNTPTGFTAGSNSASGILAASSTVSYSYNEGTGQSVTTYFNFSQSGSTTFGSGDSLDLYALNTQGDSRPLMGEVGTETLLGSFSYTTANGLTFTGANAESVPEPSSYALMFLVVAALLWQFKSSKNNRVNARAL
jgi:hypothetical protein